MHLLHLQYLKVKFTPPKDVKIAVQQKGWINSRLMLDCFKLVIVPHTKGKQSLLIIGFFLAHEDADFLELAHAKNFNVAIIPGGCTSKIQPLYVT